MKEKVIKDLTNECVTKLTNVGYMVYYKAVPLWATIYPDQPSWIDNLSIKLMEYADDEDEDDSEISYSILGLTPVIGFMDELDYSTYGDWDTKESALDWLDNPVPLY